MSSESRTVSFQWPFAGLWLVMFLVIKLGGTQLATWSYWWCLFPMVPDVVVICRKLGLL